MPPNKSHFTSVCYNMTVSVMKSILVNKIVDQSNVMLHFSWRKHDDTVVVKVHILIISAFH